MGFFSNLFKTPKKSEFQDEELGLLENDSKQGSTYLWSKTSEFMGFKLRINLVGTAAGPDHNARFGMMKALNNEATLRSICENSLQELRASKSEEFLSIEDHYWLTNMIFDHKGLSLGFLDRKTLKHYLLEFDGSLNVSLRHL